MRMANTLRQVIRGIEPTRAVYAIQPLSGYMDTTLSERRFQTLLLALFAATAILLAAIGLYGVVTFLVQQRTREIGLRVAIGAQPWHILLEICRQGAIMTLGGVAASAGTEHKLKTKAAAQIARRRCMNASRLEHRQHTSRHTLSSISKQRNPRALVGAAADRCR